MTKAQPTQVVNWDALREAGQQSQEVMLLSLPPEEIRRLRGPALRRWPGDKTGPLLDRNAPLRILLGPDLDPADEYVRLLANLGHTPQVRIYADPELADRLKPIATEPWALEGKGHYLLGRWGLGDDESQAGLAFRPFVDMGLAAQVLGDDFQKVSGQILNRYAEAVEFQQSSEGPMHLMATRISSAIVLRATRTGLWSTGFVSPEEALLVALVIQHHHDCFVAQSDAGFTAKSEAFGWYSGLAQLALPRYLPLFARLVDRLERRGKGAGGRLFDCFQGVFKRVRQLLRIHDQLAWLQLVESKSGSNKRLALQQSDLVFEAVSAIKSALDGFAVMLVTKAGVHIDAEYERVGFADIRPKGKPWRERFGSYQTVVEAIEPSISPLLDTALELRRVGTHYHPLDDVRLSFNEWIQAVNQDGTPRWVPFHEETAGAIRLASTQETSALVYGQDGLLAFDSETYALPWPFVRGLARDAIRLLSSLLDRMASVEGVNEDKQIMYFKTGSPYANFELELQRQVSIGAEHSLSGIVPSVP